MTLEILSFLVSLFSLFGVLVIFFKNYPKILALPEKKVEWKLKEILDKGKNRIKETKPFQKTFWEGYLEKNLTKARILILKAENFLFQKIQKLKEKRKEGKEVPKINFWKKIRKLK
jgi:hypothetical protein